MSETVALFAEATIEREALIDYLDARPLGAGHWADWEPLFDNEVCAPWRADPAGFVAEVDARLFDRMRAAATGEPPAARQAQTPVTTADLVATLEAMSDLGPPQRQPDDGSALANLDALRWDDGGRMPATSIAATRTTQAGASACRSSCGSTRTPMGKPSI